MSRTELAVVLVTDLVGSTALGSRLGGAGFDAFRREHDSLVRDAAEDCGGRVIKNTGDGLVIVLSSVGGALDAAVAMQQRLEERNRHAEVAMSVRIGISMGDASVEDGDYFGIPPIEATRLCARACGGEILVADSLRSVARQRSTHEFAPVGALALKGLPEPVTAWRVVWAPRPSVAGAVLPHRLRGEHATAYVGRSVERQALIACWERAVAGQRQAAIVAGEPGIGKTRLVTQLARTALPDHAVVLYGRCDEEQGIPYHPWREVLRDYVQRAPRRLLRPHADELTRLVPGLPEKLGTIASPAATDPDTERYLLFNAVQSLLAEACEVEPMLVILDDLHWADRPTLLLLKHLVTSSTTGRLMLLGTFRDSDVGQEDPLTAVLADLYREPGVLRLGLCGLDEEDIVDLIEETAGHRVDADGQALAREVHRETAGNPFFVGELLRHLRETGVIADAPDGRWSFGRSPRRGLPQSVREVIERRVRRLGPEALSVLGVGAVIGDEFDLALLARAAGLPAARALDLLDEAITASLLRRTAVTGTSVVGAELSEVYAFSHGLVQATLYAGLPAGRRAAAHQAVGEAIEAICGEEVGGRLAELAHHFLAAIPAAGAERALDYASRAGQEAMVDHAYELAAGLFARALAAAGPEDGAVRIGLLQGLGEAQMRAGDSEAARGSLFAAADAARRHDDPEALARATRACGIWGLSLGVDRPLVALAEEAIERLEGGDHPRLLAEIKGLLSVALYYGPVGEAERRQRLAVEALASARAEVERAPGRRARETLAYVLGRYLLARWGPDSATADFALADELLELCRELGDVELELLVRNWRANMLIDLGRFADVDREVAHIEHMATELRQPRAMVFLPLHRGMLAGKAGRFAEVERLNAEAMEMSRRVAGSVGQLAAASQMMLLRLQQGRMAETEEGVRALAAAYPDIVAIRSGLVVCLLAAGRREEARAELERVFEGLEGGLPRDNNYLLTLAVLGEAAAELGDAERAASLYESLAPYAGRWVTASSNTALWPVERSLGALAWVAGDLAGALAHLASARRHCEAVDALPSLARLALDEARVLVARGEPGEAARAATRSRVLAESLGMLWVCAQAAELEERIEEREPAVDGVDVVGAREHE